MQTQTTYQDHSQVNTKEELLRKYIARECHVFGSEWAVVHTFF